MVDLVAAFVAHLHPCILLLCRYQKCTPVSQLDAEDMILVSEEGIAEIDGIETEAEMEGAIEAGAGNVHEGTGTGIGIGIAAVKGAEAGKELEEAVSDAVPAGWLFERPQPHSFKHHSQFISISQRLLQRSP